MKNIMIPERIDDYVVDLHERALPDRQLVAADFYRRLVGWIIDTRTPLLYEQDHEDEYTNFSINFNWLLTRDYTGTPLGPPETIQTMYSLHEFSHMTHRLPTRLNEMTPSEYADDFTQSEYRASNETEILIHYRVPELRGIVFPGMRIAYDLMRERGIAQPTSLELDHVRALLIETNLLDHVVVKSPQDKDVLNRFKGYAGNRAWAKQRFEAIQPFFKDLWLPQSRGLTNDEYEEVIANYEPRLAQAEYEANVIRNVRFGYAMCGLAVPEIKEFNQARELAQELEGQHAIVQS